MDWATGGRTRERIEEEFKETRETLILSRDFCRKMLGTTSNRPDCNGKME